MWSGALDSSDVLQSHPLMPLALHITIILIYPLLNIYLATAFTGRQGSPRRCGGSARVLAVWGGKSRFRRVGRVDRASAQLQGAVEGGGGGGIGVVYSYTFSRIEYSYLYWPCWGACQCD